MRHTVSNAKNLVKNLSDKHRSGASTDLNGLCILQILP